MQQFPYSHGKLNVTVDQVGSRLIVTAQTVARARVNPEADTAEARSAYEAMLGVAKGSIDLGDHRTRNEIAQAIGQAGVVAGDPEVFAELRPSPETATVVGREEYDELLDGPSTESQLANKPQVVNVDHALGRGAGQGVFNLVQSGQSAVAMQNLKLVYDSLGASVIAAARTSNTGKLGFHSAIVKEPKDGLGSWTGVDLESISYVDDDLRPHDEVVGQHTARITALSRELTRLAGRTRDEHGTFAGLVRDETRAFTARLTESLGQGDAEVGRSVIEGNRALSQMTTTLGRHAATLEPTSGSLGGPVM